MFSTKIVSAPGRCDRPGTWENDNAWTGKLR